MNGQQFVHFFLSNHFSVILSYEDYSKFVKFRISGADHSFDCMCVGMRVSVCVYVRPRGPI